MKNFNTKIGGAILSLAFIFGISAVAGMTAQAQDRRDRDRDGRQDEWRDRNRSTNQTQNRDWRQNERIRREEAIRREQAIRREEALRREQARQARVYNNGVYNNGQYNNGVYNNGQYNNGTYGNYGGYGNNGGYANQARQQGYQDGLNTGASDAQRGQSYSPQRSHFWKNASSQAFRAGFEQGYDQGFRQYAGYGNTRTNRGGFGGLGSIFGP
ncbi:MAG TPA: hypothetical protein VHQ64_00115 [Pyrinomonadaceae bacterium]|jgi:hypothetical protein|nr:hypothetical protein [Pyrinomonadaceae bacterium]